MIQIRKIDPLMSMFLILGLVSLACSSAAPEPTSTPAPTVLVNGDVVGEYSLPQSRLLEGNFGLSLLSGTNKDFGTRCEMTNIHAWIPD